MRILDKNEAGRLIPVFEREAAEKATKMDRRNSLLALLCLDDAFDSVAQRILRDLIHANLRHPQTTREEQFAVHEFMTDSFLLIWEAIDLVLSNSPIWSREISSLPEITVAISGSTTEDALIEELKNKGKARPGDVLFVSSAELAQGVFINQVIIVHCERKAEVEQAVNRVIDLLLAIRKSHAVKTAINLNLTITLIDDQPVPHVNFPRDFGLREMAEARDRTIRQVMDSEGSVSLWASDLKKASADALLTIDDGIDSETNWRALMREMRETLLSYCSFKGYEESFEAKHGYPPKEFGKASEYLMQLSRPGIHTIYRGNRGDLAKELKLGTGLSNSKVNRILTSLSWREGSHYVESPIVNIASQTIYSMRGIMAATDARLEAQFSNPRFSDEVGKLFEQKCRVALKSNGFDVYPTAVRVPFNYVPEEISRRLWGRVKQGSDIDIIAKKSEFLFVLECKERKSSKNSKQLRDRFSNVQVDLMYKSLWIRDNIETFSSLLNDKWKESLLKDKAVLRLVPILVSNLATKVSDNPRIALVTYTELQHLQGVRDAGSTRGSESGADVELVDVVGGGEPQETMVL